MDDDDPLILNFTDIGAGALGQVGGKGANLAWMSQAGLPVPPGFCVTTMAFRRFVGGALAPFYSELEAVDPGDVEGTRAVAGRVRAALHALPIPPGVSEAVVGAWRALSGPEHAWAVRSSATAEDLPGASFAGQQDTYLNVRGEEPLVDAVRACWESLFTDRAVLYRAKNGFGHRGVALCVIVQRMIVPESSGILFTADPVSGSRAVASIEAGFGLGEALVGGLIEADLYKLDKATGGLREVRIGDKAFAIRPQVGGGTHQEPLPESRRRARVLSDTQAAQLCTVGRRVEAAAGAPQDIEWCYDGSGALYVVQARPITTLFPLPDPLPTDGIHVYVSFGHLQMMPDAMPPLALDTWIELLPFARGSLSGRAADRLEQPRAAGLAGSRIYLDVTTPLRIPRLRRLMLALFGAGYPQLPEALESQLGRIGPDRRASLSGSLPILRLVAPLVPRVISALALYPVERFGQRADATVIRILNCVGAPSSPAAAVDQLAILFRAVPKVAPPVIAGVVAQKLLVALGVGQTELQPVLRALPHNVTTEMDLQLADLADLIRVHPMLAAELRRGGLEAIEGRADARSFLRGFREFLEHYGMRGAGEIDLSRPRWRDDPGMLISVMLGSISGGEAGDHRRRHAAMAAAAEAAIERLVSKAPWHRRWIVRRLLRVMRAGLGLREHPKYLAVQVLDRIRAVAKAAGKDLARAGTLDRADDVWFLTWGELVEANTGRSHLRETVEARRAALALDRRRQPPLVFASDGEIPTSSPSGNLPAGSLGGIGASAGVVEGSARVVLDPAAEVLRAGEILIAPFTDPGWTPLFTHAAGLVTEIGGLMTHGSVIARELGIPAVVGAHGATTRIHTGDRVRVDGNRGYVEVIARAAP